MRYKIWNKKDPIITPIGEVLSAEEWIARYPVAGIESIDLSFQGFVLTAWSGVLIGLNNAWMHILWYLVCKNFVWH